MESTKSRASVYIVLATLAVIACLTIVTLVVVHFNAERTSIHALNEGCSEEASAFRTEAGNLAGGSKLVSYQSHYNMERHECLIEIISSRPEDGSEAVTEQIFDPSNGAFVASRDRVDGVRTASPIIMGAPVPLQRKDAAEAWFNDLTRK